MVSIIGGGRRRFNRFHSKFAKRGLDFSKYSCGMVRNSFVVVSSSYGRIYSEELEASRRTIRRKIRRVGKIYLRVRPAFSFTKKKEGSRMGKGKGKISGYFSFVRPGKVLFEVRFRSEMSSNAILAALESGASKFSIKTKVFSFPFIYG